MRTASWTTLALCLAAGSAEAADVSVGPGALTSALDAADDGDRLLLESGYYGEVEIRGHRAGAVTVTAAPNADVRMKRVRFVGASGWVLQGVRVSPSFAPTYERATMVEITGGSHHVTVADNELFSVPDDVASRWTASDWADVAANGIGVGGEGSVIRDNSLKNVAYGISVGRGTPNVEVIGNRIDSFSRDGLRGIGDFGLFEGNYVVNSYDVDDHHDDFFQSWSHGSDGSVGTGEVRGVVIRGNTFLGNDGTDRPFKGPAQGIGCFDGFFVDWVIENNVVIVDHWHGITLLGARDVRIVNNTVMDLSDGRPGPPWIQVADHKDGRRSSGIVMRNNLTTDLRLDADGSVEDHNLVFDDPSALFVDAGAFDLRLLPTAAAVDVGSAEQAPAIDHDGVTRPQGAGHDLGAFEYFVAPPRDGGVPVDAGPPSDGGVAVDAGSSTDGGVWPDAGFEPAAPDAGVDPTPAVKPSVTPDPGGCSAVHAGDRDLDRVFLGLIAIVVGVGSTLGRRGRRPGR